MSLIRTVLIRPNAAGAGWFVLVTDDAGNTHVVGGALPHLPIIDPTVLVAEVARVTAKMALGREFE